MALILLLLTLGNGLLVLANHSSIAAMGAGSELVLAGAWIWLTQSQIIAAHGVESMALQKDIELLPPVLPAAGSSRPSPQSPP